MNENARVEDGIETSIADSRSPQLLRSLLSSFGFAAQGLVYAIRSQRNMRIHICIAILALFLGFALRISFSEWLAVLAFAAIVFSAEIFNTSLEELVDLCSPEYSLHAKHAKDCAAGAVLVSAFFALIVGLLIFLPKIIELLFG